MTDTPDFMEQMEDAVLAACAEPEKEEPTPNADQQKAEDDFFEFLIGPDKFSHLTGGAGVGKTFTLNRIMNGGMDRYEAACKMFGIEQTIYDIALTATTNKAAAVLSVATGRLASTIHSYMGFVVKEDYTTGETKVTVGRNATVKSNTLIVIDEASMIDAALFELLMKYTHKCKFLFVGDHCQMAPVFEKLSKIYNHKDHFSNLTVPVRNAGQPALMDLCQQWRETVETGIFKPIVEVPGVIEYIDGPQMQQIIDNTFINKEVDSRILCYTNAQVKEFNNYIRNLRGLPSWFEVGERLISASSYNKGEDIISIEQEVEVIENPHKEITKQILDAEFDVYQIRIRTNKGMPFNVEIPSNPAHFQQLIKHFAKQKKWTAYFNLKNMYPDLRPKDAGTVYKAQGSTYDTVFIDLDDISTCTHADQVARMMYVAVSRPRTRIYLLGKLKPAYSGG